MISYLLKILALAIFSFIVIFFYYFTNNTHVENFDGYLSYIISIGVIYAVYKFIQLEFSEKKVEFSLIKILGFFSLHLFILSILFFSYNGVSLGNGIGLFMKIIFYSILPIAIIFSSISFGKKIISYLHHAKEETDIYRFILSLGIGFFSFLFLLDLFGILGFYNLYTVFLILIGFIIISYKELIGLLSGILNYKVEIDIEEGSYIKLISTEFLFLVSTLVLSISLISIVRPFPIGWDDLGVYMNHPHLMAEAGSLMSFGGMEAWQTFTGIGYMFSSPTQAFFFNIVGGFLSFILIILIVSDLLKSKIKSSDINQKLGHISDKFFINIPLLIGTLFIVMPMVVFQQAKDMKLDPGLFFVSIIILYILFKTFRKSDAKKTFINKLFNKFKKEEKSEDKINNLNYFLDNNDFLTDKKLTYKLIFIIGLLAGLAFSIKFTSLLLISAIIGLLFYTEIGFAGFLGYLGLFFALFTKAGLWNYMNIAYDKTNIVFINTFSAISAIIGIGFLLLGFLRHRENIKKFFIIFSIFIAGVLFALSPWIGKNLVQSYPTISVGAILSGKSESFHFDKTLILSDEKINEIENIKKEEALKEAAGGTIANEDWGRYFGYEKGINNYIKLPWNLTMQKNQGGEFTDIGFLFLALLPVILLFLPFKNKYFYFTILGALFLELAVFQFGFLSSFLASFTLPFGYLIIFLLFLFMVLFFLYGLDSKKDDNLDKVNLFKLNLIFSSFYTFLWSISAFGVVWYGIVMYFSFLLMIGISLYYLASYKENDTEKTFFIKLFGSLVFSLIIVIYFVNSVFPHSFNNLKSAGYKDFKMGNVSTTEASYLYHKEYLKILYVLNIDDNKKEDFLKEYINEDIQKIVSGITKMDIYNVQYILNQINKENPKFSKSAKSSLNNIYKNISNPNEKYKNKLGIYRIGTFLAYHISENNKRLLGDGLLFSFNDYIHNKNSDLTIENFKKVGVGYLLVDLNAATIDRDARHNLTKRYDKLLSTFTSTKLELIETDSVCLKIGLENYNKSDKTDNDMQTYMSVGGVNYESYSDEGKMTQRGEKMLKCFNVIKGLIENNEINNDNYSYLLSVKNHIIDNKESFKSENQLYSFLQKNITHGYKVLFKIK